MRSKALLLISALAAIAVASGWGSGGSAPPTPICLLREPEFDRASSRVAQCLPCHDGSVATEIDLHRTHPVEVSYAQAWLAKRAGLRSLPPAELVLSGGSVTCATCHDGASLEPKALAVPAASLCLGCHDR